MRWNGKRPAGKQASKPASQSNGPRRVGELEGSHSQAQDEMEGKQREYLGGGGRHLGAQCWLHRPAKQRTCLPALRIHPSYFPALAALHGFSRLFLVNVSLFVDRNFRNFRGGEEHHAHLRHSTRRLARRLWVKSPRWALFLAHIQPPPFPSVAFPSPLFWDDVPTGARKVDRLSWNKSLAPQWGRRRPGQYPAVSPPCLMLRNPA
ncbi:hypothetical protein B0I35DRAFT_435628 [Stachybotrys elegans]|uniref:Uncharacterized protein n=1 Tax=Stachybotrys elegans TaxID=80388 RepID=A0A8K0SS12_9HYPO|nr:hypothetical protein B0I35DRAFT_435628 [Stachybotrys elegans]